MDCTANSTLDKLKAPPPEAEPPSRRKSSESLAGICVWGGGGGGGGSEDGGSPGFPASGAAAGAIYIIYTIAYVEGLKEGEKEWGG